MPDKDSKPKIKTEPPFGLPPWILLNSLKGKAHIDEGIRRPAKSKKIIYEKPTEEKK